MNDSNSKLIKTLSILLGSCLKVGIKCISFLDAETDYQTPPIIQLENELEKWLTSYEPPNGPVNEIVFVDTHVENYETILAGINPNIQIVLLDNQKDGVKQIADYLTQHQSVEAIHIISHGSYSDGRKKIIFKSS